MMNFEKTVSVWDKKEESVKQVVFQLPSCIKTEEGAEIYADLFSISRLSSAIAELTISMVRAQKAATKAATKEERDALSAEIARLQAGIDTCEGEKTALETRLEETTGRTLPELRSEFPFLSAHTAYFSQISGADSEGKKIPVRVQGIESLMTLTNGYIRTYGNCTPDVACQERRKLWEEIRTEAETIAKRWFEFSETTYCRQTHADLKAWQVNLVIGAITGMPVIAKDGYTKFKPVSKTAYQKALIGIFFKRLLPEKPVSVKTGKQETII